MIAQEIENPSIRQSCERHMNNLKFPLAFFLFFFAATSAGESIYKWVDEQGVTHYSAATPADKKAQQLKVPVAPAQVDTTDQSPTMKNWQANQSLKNIKEKRAREEEAENQEKAEKEKRCDIAKQRLGILQQQTRLYRTNNKGEQEYWNDAEREAETKRMQEEIKSNC
jgi:hypothetical protein